jgi:hypothetical protein
LNPDGSRFTSFYYLLNTDIREFAVILIVKLCKPDVIHPFLSSLSIRIAAGMSARQRQIVIIRFIDPSVSRFSMAAASISSR